MDVQGASAGKSLMHVAFAADASVQIGTGHVMRCLTLADTLRERGAHSRFICRPFSGHLLEVITQRGPEAFSLPPPTDAIYKAPPALAYVAWLRCVWPTDVEQTRQALSPQTAATPLLDWLIVDHYALDQDWV